MRGNLTRLLFLLAFPCLVAGCKTAQERAAQEAALAEKDERECVSYGAQPGSQSYIDCRLKLKEIRQSEENAIISRPPPRVAPRAVTCSGAGAYVTCF
jgi:hypothetical protein